MHITKDLVQAHITCPRLAYTRMHEPTLPAFVTPEALDRMAEGASVGRAAREEFPDGVMVPPGDWHHRLAATEELIDAGTPVIFEAAFEAAGDLRAVVDVLEVSDGGLHLTEVKSSTAIEREHLYDLAFQVLAIDTLGYRVNGTSLMHLNAQYRAQRASAPLFLAEDVWAQVAKILPELPSQVHELKSLSSDPTPPPWKFRTPCKHCPLRSRCEPADPDHIRTLYYVTETEASKFETLGITAIRQIPATWKTSSKVRRRQVDVARSGQVCVDTDQLLADLAPLAGKTIAHMDFETVQTALPVFPGTAPWQQIPVQWSCHMEVGDQISHAEWLAKGPGDPREEFALTLLRAIRDAAVLTVWNERFEKAVLADLAEFLPHLRADLRGASEKIIDLLKVVRGSVYHAGFRGSFSLKRVLPSLVPSLSYAGQNVQNGAEAAVQLKRLLRGDVRGDAVAGLRRDLLAYCELDTWAEVAILRRLFEEVGR